MQDIRLRHNKELKKFHKEHQQDLQKKDELIEQYQKVLYETEKDIFILRTILQMPLMINMFNKTIERSETSDHALKLQQEAIKELKDYITR